MSRSKPLQHTLPSELTQHTLDDISCIPWLSRHDAMHLTRSQQKNVFEEVALHLSLFPARVPPTLSTLTWILFYGFLTIQMFHSRCLLRGVGSARTHARTHTCTHTRARHFAFVGACGGKTSGTKLRQETEYIILSTTSPRNKRQTLPKREGRKKEKEKKKEFSLQLFHKRKHAC